MEGPQIGSALRSGLAPQPPRYPMKWEFNSCVEGATAGPARDPEERIEHLSWKTSVENRHAAGRTKHQEVQSLQRL
jgi:hypothetical protein